MKSKIMQGKPCIGEKMLFFQNFKMPSAIAQKSDHEFIDRLLKSFILYIRESSTTDALLMRGEVFNFTRKAMGMSRKDLVNMTGFSDKTLIRFEKGLHVRNYNFMVRLYKQALLAHAYRCQADKIVVPQASEAKMYLMKILHTCFSLSRPLEDQSHNESAWAWSKIERIITDCFDILSYATHQPENDL